MIKNTVIKWLGSQLNNPELNEENLQQLLYFSLLWNYFESKYFSNTLRLNEQSMSNMVGDVQDNISNEEISKIFSFFKKTLYFT